MTNINYMNNPIVSFIVPSYNFAAHITECVDSILAQTISEIEVIVVNDGSTDNTKEILEIIAQKDARVRPINKENEGVSIARNTGLLAAMGEYVSFVDADDYVASDYASYMLELAKTANSDFCLSLDAFTRAGENQTGGVFYQQIFSPRSRRQRYCYRQESLWDVGTRFSAGNGCLTIS